MVRCDEMIALYQRVSEGVPGSGGTGTGRARRGGSDSQSTDGGCLDIQRYRPVTVKGSSSVLSQRSVGFTPKK